MANKKPKGQKGLLKPTLGRPTIYTQDLADTICTYIATTSKSLRKICEIVGIDPITITRWLREKDDFCIQYTHAKEEQADLMCDEIMEIADDSSNDIDRIDDFGNPIENREFISRSRLRVESRKWLASKLKPKKYGDKQSIDHTITVEQPLFPDSSAENSKKLIS